MPSEFWRPVALPFALGLENLGTNRSLVEEDICLPFFAYEAGPYSSSLSSSFAERTLAGLGRLGALKVLLISDSVSDSI
jgi:hypothetical protein